MSSVHDLLSAVAVDVEARDWREAIARAGELLVSTGAAGRSYIEAMIDVVELNGPYVVITPGVAFAHARPDESVQRTAMTLVRLAAPVEFGHETNDPVTLVIALAAVDADAHQDALASLATLLADPHRREALETADSPERLREALLASGPSASTPPSSAAAPSSAAPPSSSAASPVTTSPSPGAPTSPVASTGPVEEDPSFAPEEQNARAHDPQAQAATAAPTSQEGTVASTGLVLTVCGNGLGTSLFLKNTLEGVLDHWGWTPYLRVEATDTISARGRAKECDAILTSGAIAQTLGEVGVPVEVIDDFTSGAQLDSALRRIYAV